MDLAAAIVIGDENGQHVAIRPLRRSHPGRTDYWDGNWIESEVSISAGAFRTTYQASLRSEEFLGFCGELRLLFKTLAGKATFHTMEEQLELTLIGDGKGHLAVEGVACDPTGNTLKFAFELDQTYLAGIIRRVEGILATFPVVGSP